MATLDDFREQYPQYKDVPDEDLADGLYKKFYADKVPRDVFYEKVGLKTNEPAPAPPRESVSPAAFRDGVPGPGEPDPDILTPRFVKGGNVNMPEYPGLAGQDIGYRESYHGHDHRGAPTDGRKLEFYRPDEDHSFAKGRPAVEVFDPSVSNKDIMGELYSHYLPNVDPEFKKGRDEFIASLTDHQKLDLAHEYAGYRRHMIDNTDRPPESFEEWVNGAGGDSIFRGFVTGQWPASAYTPEQRDLLSALERRLTGQAAPTAPMARGLSGSSKTPPRTLTEAMARGLTDVHDFGASALSDERAAGPIPDGAFTAAGRLPSGDELSLDQEDALLKPPQAPQGPRGPEARALPEEKTLGRRMKDTVRSFLGMDPYDADTDYFAQAEIGRKRARAYVDMQAQRLGMTPEEMRDQMAGQSDVQLQFANGAMQAFTAGLAPDMANDPQKWTGEVAKGLGHLGGFLVSPAMLVGEVAVAATGLSKFFGVAATDPRIIAIGKDMAVHASKLGIASSLEKTGEALDQTTVEAALKKYGEGLVGGAEMGAIFGASGRILPNPGALDTLGRAAMSSVALDVLNQQHPFDDRPLWQKVYDYGQNLFFSRYGANGKTRPAEPPPAGGTGPAGGLGPDGAGPAGGGRTFDVTPTDVTYEADRPPPAALGLGPREIGADSPDAIAARAAANKQAAADAKFDAKTAPAQGGSNEHTAADESVVRKRSDRMGYRAEAVDTPLAPAEKERSDAQIAAAAEASQRAREARVVKPESDDLLAAIAKEGGISREAAKKAGIDPAEFGRRGWGIHRVFTAGGKTMEAMSERLAAAGYPVTDKDGNYGENPMLEALDRALHGEAIRTQVGHEAAANATAAEREQEPPETGYDDTRDPFDFAHEPMLEDHEYADLDNHNQRVLMDATIAARNAGASHDDIENVIERGAIRGLSDEDIAAELRALTERKRVPGAGRAAEQPKEEAPPPVRAPEREAQGQGGGGQEEESGGEALTSYSAEDLAQRERDKATAAAARAKEDAKAEADAQRDDFVLTGSDRTADTAAARGQAGLFDQAPSKPAEKAEVPNEQPATVPTAGTAQEEPGAIARRKVDATFERILKLKGVIEHPNGLYQIPASIWTPARRQALTRDATDGPSQRYRVGSMGEVTGNWSSADAQDAVIFDESVRGARRAAAKPARKEATDEDVALLEQYGEDGLREQGMHGVLDRLEGSGKLKSAPDFENTFPRPTEAALRDRNPDDYPEPGNTDEEWLWHDDVAVEIHSLRQHAKKAREAAATEKKPKERKRLEESAAKNEAEAKDMLSQYADIYGPAAAEAFERHIDAHPIERFGYKARDERQEREDRAHRRALVDPKNRVEIDGAPVIVVKAYGYETHAADPVYSPVSHTGYRSYAGHNDRPTLKQLEADAAAERAQEAKAARISGGKESYEGARLYEGLRALDYFWLGHPSMKRKLLEAASRAFKNTADEKGGPLAELVDRVLKDPSPENIKALVEKEGAGVGNGRPPLIVENNLDEYARRVSEILGGKGQETPPAKGGAVEAEAHEAATSDRNDLPQPTEAQKEAGNYAKGHLVIDGVHIAIENPAGSSRRPEWPPLKDHYGYIKRTEGADGDHVDVFIKPGAETSPSVYIVDQVDPKTGRFDEHKVMLGYDSVREAREAYLANYEQGWQGLGAMTFKPWADFKDWLKVEDQRVPANPDLADKEAALPPVAAEEPSSAPAKDERPGMLTSGERLRSESGRELAPVPTIDTSTERKAQNSIRRMNAWLLDEARKEAAATGNGYLTTMLQGLDVKNFSPSDQDTVNSILFGDEEGPKAKHRLQRNAEARGRADFAAGKDSTPPKSLEGAERDAWEKGWHAANAEAPVPGIPSRVTPKGAVTVEGYNWKPERELRDDTVLVLDVAKADALWAKDEGMYVAPGGKGAAIGSRYERFGEWLNGDGYKNNGAIEMPNVYMMQGRGNVLTFGNGRHRWAWMRDHGITRIPVTVDPENAQVLRDAGIVADERAAGDIGEKSGEKPNKSGSAASGEQNKIFTKAKADEALKLLRSKFGQLNMGLDPEMIQALVMRGGYHVERGVRGFAEWAKEMVAEMGNGVKPYLSWLYKTIAEYPGFDAKGMDELAKLPPIESIFPAEVTDVSGGREYVESGGKDSAAQAPVNGEAVFAEPGTPERPARAAGSDPEEARAPEQGDSGVPVDRPAPRREQSDKPVHGANGQFDFEGDAAGGNERRGRLETSSRGVESDAEAVGAAEADARQSPDLDKRERQRAASRLPVVLRDPKNIAETLPYLLEGQHDDVLKAERRFEKGAGILFTNGTGTGKTYTGLGIIARHIRATGDDNVLIVVPSQPKVTDWIEDGANVDVPISRVESKRDKGAGVVVTTYANFRDNWWLPERDFSLIVYDESHYLKSASDTEALALQQHRAIARHPRGMYDLAWRRDPEARDLEMGRRAYVQEAAERQIRAKMERSMAAGRSEEVARRYAEEAVAANIDDIKKAANEEYRREHEEAYKAAITRTTEMAHEFGQRYPKPANVVFLSASPFPYHFSLDYGEGFLFDFGQRDGRGYNSGDGRDLFYMTNLGYRMRYNKLTRPEAEVDQSLMERNLAERLKKEGVMSGRLLETGFDYSRQFVRYDDELGRKIDRGFHILQGYKENDAGEWERDKRYDQLPDAIRRRFNHTYLMQLREGIAGANVTARVDQHLALGRKVVVFHDFRGPPKGHPFDLSDLVPAHIKGVSDQALIKAHAALRAEIALFQKENPDLVNLPLTGLQPVVEAMQRKYGNRVAFINGTVSPREKDRAKAAFNSDNSGVDIIVVQRLSGREGISLHDISGKRQRALVDVGLPIAPVDAIQTEGRINRFGVKSDAVIEYPVLHTSFERYAFFSKVSERSSTAENLAMGELARGLKLSFRDGYQNYTEEAPSLEQGKGGAKIDRTLATNTPYQNAIGLYFGTISQKGKRRDQRAGKDYFATPEPLGYKMVEWAGIRSGEDVLEPSAGHGAIARFFPENANATAIEPSYDLQEQLQAWFDGRRIRSNFEDHHVVNKYDAIVMNPPFGHGGATAIAHLDKAIKHLREGGRLVALIPEGPAADKAYEKWYEGVLGVYQVAEFGLPTVTFERAGTSVKARVVVLDKWEGKDAPKEAGIGQMRRDIDAEKVSELFEKLEYQEVPARAARPVQEEPAEKPKPAKADLPPNTQVAVTEEKNTRTGEPVWYGRLDRKVEREEYAAIADVAKKHGGYWSRFKSATVRPGFIFPSAESANAFAKEVGQKPLASMPLRPGKGTLTKQEVERVVEQTAGAIARKFPLAVVERQADLPLHLSPPPGSRPYAIYDNGRIYVIAENNPDRAHVAAAVAHEVFGHLGPEATVKNWDEVGDAIAQLVREGNPRAVSISNEVRARYPNDPPGSPTFVREFIAIAAERKHAGPMRRLLSIVRAGLRRFLKAIGLKRMLTDAEIDVVLRNGEVYLRTDGKTGDEPTKKKLESANRTAQAHWYSKLQRSVEESNIEKATPEQWMAFFRRSGVKEEELKWMDMEAFFEAAAHLKSVPRSDIVEYLRANQLEVREAVRGEDPEAPPKGLHGEVTVRNIDGAWRVFDGDRQQGEDFEDEMDAQDEAWHYIEELADQGHNTTALDTKYGSYALPGGENYRELLITLPTKNDGPPVDLNDVLEGRAQIPQTVGPEYRSHHWDEPNVLVHVRFNERTSHTPAFQVVNRASGNRSLVFATREEAEKLAASMPSGLRVQVVETTRPVRTLFVEEIQSDWHQQGRQNAYAVKSEKPWVAWDRSADAGFEAQFDTEAEANAYIFSPENAGRNLDYAHIDTYNDRVRAVPNGPFKQSWPMLGMKRVIRWAAENGFDRVAWTPGDVQADRFDLSHTVSSISWDNGKEGKSVFIDLQAQYSAPIELWARPDGTVADAGGGRYEGKQLSEIVGKPLADRIMAEDSGRASGDGLKLGGAGMRGFYDKILPAETNKYIKQWGGKVGRHEVATGMEQVRPIYEGAIPTRAQIAEVLKLTRERGNTMVSPINGARLTFPLERVANTHALESVLREIDAGSSAAEALGWAGTHDLAEIFGGEIVRRQGKTMTYATAHGFDVTPAMRESVLGGQPLFSRPREEGDSARMEHIPTTGGPAFDGPDIALFPGGRRQDGRFEFTIVDSARNSEGLGALVLAMDGDRITRLHNIVVDEEKRGQGIGTRVVRAILDTADRPIEVRDIFPGSLEFWRRMGLYDEREEGRHGLLAPSGSRTEGARGAERETAAGAGAGAAGGGPRAHESVTDTPAFRRWFGDSKVVDAAGKPLVVYHGTKADLTTFDANAPRARQAFKDAQGFYFTTDAEAAGNYGGIHRASSGGARVMPVYLKMENPKRVSSKDSFMEHPAYISPSERAAIEAQGYDGVIFNDGQELVVFRPEQIKSATGNRGTFDPSSPNILYSMPPRDPREPLFPDGFDLPSESRKDWLIRNWQDRFRRILVTQRAIVEAGGRITDESDPYLRDTLFPGRSAERLSAFDQNLVKPLIEAMHAEDVSLDELDMYLYARHAPERNEHIAQIRPDMPDGGSGMTDAEAAAVMAAVPADRRDAFERLAARVDAINAARLALLEEYGLEHPRNLHMWRTQYQHYVPLRGFRSDQEEHMPGRGRGYDVRGKESRQALGRASLADSPTVYTIAQMEMSIIRAEKNRVGQAFLALVLQHPNKRLWNVHQAGAGEYKPYFDRAAGEVMYRRDPAKRWADNVLIVKRDGKEYVITLQDEGNLLARALKNMGPQSSNVAIEALGKFMRFLAATRTSYSPSFVISNFMRDLGEAIINLHGERDVGDLQPRWRTVRVGRTTIEERTNTREAAVSKVVADVPRALRGIFNALYQRNLGGEWERLYEQFRMDGGKMSFFGMRNLEQQREHIADTVAALNGGKIRRAWEVIKALGDHISSINEVVENGVRLAAYKAALDAGLSRPRAAAMARNLTINFTKHGEWGQIASRIYLFFNANVQGAMRTLRTAMRSPRVRKILVAIASASFLLGLFNRWMGGENSAGMSNYDAVPMYVKTHNIVLMNPNGQGGYAKIPLPYGYNVPAVMGTVLEAAANSKDFTPERGAMTLVGSLVDSFNPLGSSDSQTFWGWAAKNVAPTIVDPVVELAMNENWAGRKLHPDQPQFGPPLPQSQLYFNSVSESSKHFTHWLNSVSGGDEVMPGRLDFNPATLDQWFQFFGGAIGQDVISVFELPAKWVDSEHTMETRDIPVVRRFYSDADRHAIGTKYRELVNDVELARNQAKAYRERGDAKTARELEKKHKDLLGLSNSITYTESVLKDLRKQRRAIQGDKRIDEATRQKRLKNKDAEIEKRQAVVVKRWEAKKP